MPTYAIIRLKTPYQDGEDQPPAAVFEVERETATTLFGKMLYKDGRPLARDHNYDRQPETDPFRIGQPADFRVPGRVKASREIARHDTREAAAAGLKSAQEAWGKAEDRSAYNDAAATFLAADRDLADERRRLLADVENRLAALQAVRDAANTARREAKAAMFARMDAAAIEAAGIPVVRASPPALREEG